MIVLCIYCTIRPQSEVRGKMRFFSSIQVFYVVYLRLIGGWWHPDDMLCRGIFLFGIAASGEHF